ncbi:bifunctional 3-phenylpropionate/cinnamic acid dioxygenase ferredoxin subunit [Pseudonocardia acidicola]|uniref:Bifunctional 3-phenylpropionate/cinnamic acid dioxygenase ferredoxin subunit n=1 Tax=Pseudonocardia acidicola TaxID=2724939 RepID=A0ABX1SFI6_9PSEU|nr:bifunctional 3-phenylpropionate/cinnamic acid dioxygenase ferredoxin subunit [Pseudonocardia acidicola]NMH99662.1 bifunctional 3-phenylpropionate/cinnamic acid dioxygenase ferredoxin subunit [Pseudonocardia acidicola]
MQRAERRTSVCPVAELPPGAMRRVEAPGTEAITVYNVDGEFHATADTCTHALASLAEGDLEGAEVSCPVHWARFDVRTGAALCFPATEDLRTYRVEVTDGMVSVLLDAEPADPNAADPSSGSAA